MTMMTTMTMTRRMVDDAAVGAMTTEEGQVQGPPRRAELCGTSMRCAWGRAPSCRRRSPWGYSPLKQPMRMPRPSPGVQTPDLALALDLALVLALDLVRSLHRLQRCGSCCCCCCWLWGREREHHPPLPLLQPQPQPCCAVWRSTKWTMGVREAPSAGAREGWIHRAGRREGTGSTGVGWPWGGARWGRREGRGGRS